MDVLAMHHDATLCGLAQARQNADEGGFTRAIGAKQTKKLTLSNVKAHLIECCERLAARIFGRVSFGDGLKRDGGHEPLILRSWAFDQELRHPIKQGQFA